MSGVYSRSVLKSIFVRKGGEGRFTKIIGDEETNESLKRLNVEKANPDESLFVLYYFDALNWLALTTVRIIASTKGMIYIIQNANIVDVSPALSIELLKGVSSKKDFSVLNIQDGRGVHQVEVEAGIPYWGIYQVLHYITSTNSRTKKRSD